MTTTTKLYSDDRLRDIIMKDALIADGKARPELYFLNHVPSTTYGDAYRVLQNMVHAGVFSSSILTIPLPDGKDIDVPMLTLNSRSDILWE